MRSIGQQKVIMSDGNVNLKTVYTDNGKVGIIKLSTRQLMVTLYESGTDANGRQTWKVQTGKSS